MENPIPPYVSGDTGNFFPFVFTENFSKGKMTKNFLKKILVNFCMKNSCTLERKSNYIGFLFSGRLHRLDEDDASILNGLLENFSDRGNEKNLLTYYENPI